MQDYTVSFFGHREITNHRQIDEQLTPILEELILTKPFVTFLVGRHGEFDTYAASVIKHALQKRGKETADLTLVLPCAVADLAYYEQYYDSILIPDELCGVHPKSAIKRKNEWVVDHSDLVIVNVERAKGGAYTAMRYAEKQGKTVVNLYAGVRS